MINSFLLTSDSFLFDSFGGYEYVPYLPYLQWSVCFLSVIILVISMYWFSSSTPYNFYSTSTFLFFFFISLLFFLFLESFVFSSSNFTLTFLLWLYFLTIVGGFVYFQNKFFYFEYFFFILSSFFLSICVIFLDNMFFLFFFMECNVFMISLLIGTLDKTNIRSVEASFLYFIANSIIGLCFLLCVSILYGYTGVLSLSELSSIVVYFDSSFLDLTVLFLMLVLSFKIYSFPYNTWVPVLYRSINLHILLFLSTGYLLPLYIVFYNFYSKLFIFYSFSGVLSVIGALNMIFGFISMLTSLDIRNVLAYSSIFTTGFFFVVLSFDLTAQSIVFVMSYGVAVFCFFSIYHFISVSKGDSAAYVVPKKLSNGLFSVESLFYIFKQLPMIGFFLYFIFFYIVGFPVFYLFFTKISVIFSSMGGYFFSSFILLLGILMSSLFYVPLIRFGIFKTKNYVSYSSAVVDYRSYTTSNTSFVSFFFMLLLFTFFNINFFFLIIS